MTFSQRFLEQDREVSIIVTENASNKLIEASNPKYRSAEELPQSSEFRGKTKNNILSSPVKTNQAENSQTITERSDCLNIQQTLVDEEVTNSAYFTRQ